MSLPLEKHLTDQASSRLPAARAETSLLLLQHAAGREGACVGGQAGLPQCSPSRDCAWCSTTAGQGWLGHCRSKGLKISGELFSSTRGALPRGNSWIVCTNSQYLNVPGPWLPSPMFLLIRSRSATQQLAHQGQQRRCWHPETTYFVTSEQLDF